MFCSSCGAKLAKTARFCASCGVAVTSAGEATLADREEIDGETLAPESVRRTPTPRHTAAPDSFSRPTRISSGSVLHSSSSAPIGGGRFAPGTIVAGRYRIVALAGKGGMGEVYRADDLKLTQTVAVKFLPEALTSDPGALERFHSEVRMARQVSHPNVCRVFDIGESDGVTYLTMEYVDGEDLGSLVRRIGRLSQDKGVEIARQICAGLAAAHERGVVHRDLKPANVMLDGQGKARITDFGLAGIAASIEGAEVRAGTPAYMAPEQLAGKEVTFKSDLYSLGLVLYEILTGKRAYEAATLQELIKLREQSAPTNPSLHVRDLDPLVERVILRCLERDPAKRPTSALQVSAALPGGDPLAAALAAGETPSPQMVAAAGETNGLAPRIAVSCLAGVLIGISLIVFLGIRENGLEGMQLENSPEVLGQKARETIVRLGYGEKPADSAGGFHYSDSLLDYVSKNDKPQPNWGAILGGRLPWLWFWYRQSPQPMRATEFWQTTLTPGVITVSDPPPLKSGMVTVRLDPQGHLLDLLAVPPEKEESSPSEKSANWTPLFEAAGIDAAGLRASPPVWTATVASDTRAAWDGVWPGTARPLHIEAAAFQGKPVYFAMMGPWTEASRSSPPAESRADRISTAIGLFMAAALLIGGTTLAYRNFSKGKGDRRGAWRLSVAVFALEMLICAFRAHFSSGLDSVFVVTLAVSTGFFVAALMWMFYMALEPYVRRHWPQTIISWTRLLDGRLRDPLIGRDLLWGVVLGAAWVLTFEIGYRYSLRTGAQPLFGATDLFLGFRETVAYGLTSIVGSVLGALVFFMVLVMLRVFLRNRWVAAAVFVAVFSAPKIIGSTHRITDAVVWILIYAIAAVAVVRFGLVVLTIGTFMANALLNTPYTANFSNWYAPNGYVVVSIFVVLALWGFYTSLAGKKLFERDLFD